VNIKKGLKRIWVVGSVLWVVMWVGLIFDKGSLFSGLGFMIGGLSVGWGLLYTGFWISSGFSGDDKKKGDTDE
jgi:hypothetical protein